MRSGFSVALSWGGSVAVGRASSLAVLALVRGGVDGLAEARGWFPADGRSEKADSGGRAGWILRYFNAAVLLSSSS